MWIIWEGTILRNVVLSRRCLYKPISILSLQFDSMPNIFLRYRSCYAKVPGHDTTKSTVSTSGSTAPMSRRLSTAMRRLVVSEAEDQMRYECCIHSAWSVFWCYIIINLNKSGTIIDRIYMLIVIYREEMAWQNAQTILQDVRENLTRSKNFNIPTG